jgi:hypothetical protein
MGSGFSAATQLALVDNPNTKRKILAQTLFPNDPQGIWRVGFDGDGQPVYVGDDNKLHRIASGTAQFGAQLLANAPETVAAGVGALGGPGVAAGMAAGVHGLKRGAAGLYYDEPQSVVGNLAGMATEGAATLAGEGLGRGIAGLTNRGRVVDFTPANFRAAENVRQHVLRTTGVDLDLAQASGDPRLIALRAYVARYPGPSANLIRASEDAANGQFDTATHRVLDQIAVATPSEIAGEHGVNAAQMAIQAAQRQANAAAQPLYQAAYQAMPRVTDTNILRYLNLPYFPEAFESGQRMAQLEGQGLRQYQPPDLRSLDYLKRGLDDTIERLSQTSRAEARALRQRRNEFVQLLDNVNPQYQQARATYQQAMQQIVSPLENGSVGVLARIDDPNVAKAAAKVLSDPSVSSQMITDTRTALEQQNPTAWRGLVRQWVADKYDRAMRETQAGDIRNPAGKLRQAVFGSPEDRARMHAMLGPQAMQTMDDLMLAAERLASTPTAGSNTFRDLETKEMLKGATGRIADVFRWISTPRASALNLAERRAVERGTQAIAEALVDPTRRGQLRVVLRMRPSTRQAVLLSNVIGAQTAKDYVKSRMPQGEDTHLVATDDKSDNEIGGADAVGH